MRVQQVGLWHFYCAVVFTVCMYVCIVLVVAMMENDDKWANDQVGSNPQS